MRTRQQRQPVIRASEISQYIYCAQAWWQENVQDLPSTHGRELKGGEADHRRHGRGVEAATRLRQAAYVVLLLAAVLAIVWLISRGGGS